VLAERRGIHALDSFGELAKTLTHVDRVVSSPLCRAQQTASVLSSTFELDERWTELDYGELSDLMSFDELDDDHSARDIHLALEALGRHEYLRSADIYQGVLGHWANIRSHEQTN
jgi:phosphohistidine phosphatase SixA